MTNLKEAQKNTILGMVNEIYEKGEFICPAEDPVEDNEKIIGVATDYEKAIFLAAKVCMERHDHHIENTKKEDLDMPKLSADKRAQEAFIGLFWGSVKNRLAKEINGRNGTGLKKDWKLVAFDAKPKERIEIHFMGIGGLPFLGFPTPPTAPK